MSDVVTIEDRIAARIDHGVTGSLALATNRTGGLAFANMGQVMEFAKTMAVAQIAIPKHLRGNPGACLGICIQAVEWEMSPFAVANKSYSVNDRLAYEAQLIAAVILRRAPIKGRFKVEFKGEGAARVCRVWANLREEGETVEYVSPPFGSINPKNSPLWKTDPDQQQFYYSCRALCRRHFPDVLLGVYAVDEYEPPLVDGSNVRDVTPKRNLSEKLDALACAVPAHDAETGEIIERPDKQINEPQEASNSGDGAIPRAESEVKAGEASTGVSPAENKARAQAVDEARKPAGPTAEERRASLLADLRSQGDGHAANGTAALNGWLDNELSGDEMALLSHAAVKRWKEIAAQADKQAT